MRKLFALIAICIFLLTSCTPPIVVEISYASTSTPTPREHRARTTTPKTSRVSPARTPSTRNRTARATQTAEAEAIAANPAGSEPVLTGTATPVVAGAAAQNNGVPVSGSGKVPAFDHIVVIMMENHGFPEVIGSSLMPNLNALAKQYVLLSQYYAIRHPSLPNYIGLFSGDTYGITKDCTTCYLNQPNLADRIEASGRTWKDYQEDMPSPCFVGSSGDYQQKHNPFMYFDDIRLDAARCSQSVVPLTQLDADLAANRLPNFAFIMPNMCNSAHDCSLETADKWLGAMVSKLQNSPALGQNSLIVVLFDEYDGNNASCCGLPARAGGQVSALLISPLAKPGFNDSAPYSHYSLLKTILAAWSLPDLGNTALPHTSAILDAWK